MSSLILYLLYFTVQSAMHNKLFDKGVNKVALVFKWIITKQLQIMSHTYCCAIAVLERQQHSTWVHFALCILYQSTYHGSWTNWQSLNQEKCKCHFRMYRYNLLGRVYWNWQTFQALGKEEAAYFLEKYIRIKNSCDYFKIIIVWNTKGNICCNTETTYW